MKGNAIDEDDIKFVGILNATIPNI